MHQTNSIRTVNQYSHAIQLVNSLYLRGGGCTISPKQLKYPEKIQHQLPENFLINIQVQIKNISEKSYSFSDKMSQDDVLSAFQWFFNNKEYFQIICNDDLINSQCYDQIEKGVAILMKQLIVYIKLSGYLFYSLLQIINDFFKIIFSYQLKNEDRYIQEEFKQILLEIISEIESQIKLEVTNIWKTGVEYELQLTKICIAHLKTNSEKGQQLIISILCGVAQSISSLKPSSELIDSLIEGGKFLLLNFYDKQIKNPLKKYEVYYFFENLKWSIISQLKLGYSVQKIIYQLKQGFCQYIKPSQDWMIHYCWINLLTDLISYRLIIKKSEFQSNNQENWIQLVAQNQIQLLPYDKNQAKVSFFSNNENYNLLKIAQFRILQEFLLNHQNDILLLPSYVEFKLDNQIKAPLNNKDVKLQLLCNESNLEIIYVLNENLKSYSKNIQHLFEDIDQELSTFKPCKNKEPQSKLMIAEKIYYSIKSIKKIGQSCLYNLFELEICLNQQRELLKIISNILNQNKQHFQTTTLKLYTSLISSISKIEQKYQEIFLGNVNQILKFWVQICHTKSILKDRLHEQNLTQMQITKEENKYDEKKFIESSLAIIKFLDWVFNELQKLKTNSLNILKSNEIKEFLNEKISMSNYSQKIINVYDIYLIKALVNELDEYYSKNWNKKEQLFQVFEDFSNSFIGCNFIVSVLKCFRNLLNLQKRKINTFTRQQKYSSVNQNFEENLQTSNNIDILSTIKLMITQQKDFLINLSNKFKNQKFNEEHAKALQNAAKEIQMCIKLIQNQNCSQDLKTKYISFFFETENKILTGELLKLNFEIVVQEIIQIFDSQLDKMNLRQEIEGQEIMNQVNADLSKINKENTNLIFNQEDLFNSEQLIFDISELIIKSQKFQSIIQKRMSNIHLNQFKSLQETLGNSLIINYIKIQLDIQLDLNQCCRKFLLFLQTIFDQEKLKSFSIQETIHQIEALQIIFNNNNLFNEQIIENSDQGDFDDKRYISFFRELQKNFQNSEENEIFEIFQDSSNKVRESLAFNLIKLQSIVNEDKIQEFCSNLLKQLWMIEKQASVRNILKNKEMIEMQKKLFSRNLTTFSNQLKTEMQKRLKKLEQLETLVLLSDNQTETKNQLQQAYDDFEIYLDNITEMSHKMDISLIFLREISKDLKTIKSSINQILQSVKGIEDDVRKLRGKDYFELLLIRKDKVLKYKQQAELDQVHIQFTTQEYDPSSGQKIENKNGAIFSYLIKNHYNDFEGEINEFIWKEEEKNKDVMLLKGKAGSGKSRASRNIEEFLWMNDYIQPNWIPIYISLPQLNDPRHNLIDQALESSNYNFDKIQIREFKEAVINGKIKIVLILESYDEMKFEYIQTNLFYSNRLNQELNILIPGKDVKIIITTRNEILTSIGYQTWFYGQNIKTLKEVELLLFTTEQSAEYLKQYTEISVKRTIKQFYEFLKQLKNQNFCLDEFKTIWNQIYSSVQGIINQSKNQEMIFKIEDVEKLISKLQKIEFFSYIKGDQMVSLKKELLELWGHEKFTQVIRNVNINHLLSTPFMMEIIVYVLPKMSLIFSEANFLRELLKKNYMFLKMEAFKSESRTIKYEQQQKKLENIDDIENQQQKIQDIQNPIIVIQNIQNQFEMLVEELEGQNFFEFYSIAHQIDFYEHTKILTGKTFNVTKDAKFIVTAFKMNQFTAYDFYETFVNFYHTLQLQKWKDLGKIINYESSLIDLNEFSLYLAIDMTLNQKTQVNYVQKGKLCIQSTQDDEGKVNATWEEYYFDENNDEQQYKSLLRKCMLINAKGNVYSFNHKSIQEFLVAKYILTFLQKITHPESITIFLEILRKNKFNKTQFNISLDHFSGTLELLIPKLKQITNLKHFLIQIIQATSEKEEKKYNLTPIASNAIYLLSILGENLDNINLSNICISNTKLNGLNFFQSNLSQSKFDNVSIEMCNFNCTSIENAEWNNLICKDKPQLNGHTQLITSIVFTKDGKYLISGSEDNTLRKWEVYGDKMMISQFIKEKVRSIFIPRDQDVLTCLTDETIYLLNLQDLSLIRQLPLINYNYQNMLFASDLSYVAIQNDSNKISIFEMKSLDQNLKYQNHISQFKIQIYIKCIAVNSTFKILATGGKKLHLWKINGLSDIEEMAVIDKHVITLAFSPNEQVLATADYYKIYFWNVQNLKQIELLFSISSIYSISRVEYSKNGKYFAFSNEKQLKLYQSENIMQQQDYFDFQVFNQNTDSQISAIEIFPDCKKLIINSFKEQSIISIWDIQDLSQIYQITTLPEISMKIIKLKLSANGKILLSVCNAGSIIIWDLEDSKILSTIKTQQEIYSITIATDLQLFATSNNDKTIIIWDISNKSQPQNVFTFNLQENWGIAEICPFSNILVSFNNYYAFKLGIQLWDINKKIKISTLLENEFLQSLCFDNEGVFMATFTQCLTIWERNDQTFQKQRSFKFECNYIKQCIFKNTENLLIYKSDDSNIIEISLTNQEKIVQNVKSQIQIYSDRIIIHQKFIVLFSSNVVGIQLIDNLNHFEKCESSNVKGYCFSHNSEYLAISLYPEQTYLQLINKNQKILINNILSEFIQFNQNDLLLILYHQDTSNIIIYNIEDIEKIYQIANIQLPYKPIQICFLNQTQQIMVLNEHFITLHDINNLSVSKICQLSKAKQKQSNLIITPNEEYFGFVLDDQICFQSLFNYIEMTYYQKFNNKILYNSFSADNKLFYIIDQKSNFIQIDLNSKKKIEDNLEFGYINILTLNWQGTEAIFNRSNSQLESNKLLLADIKAKKEVQIIENIHIDIEYRKIIFSADEKNFMTGYQDQTIKYWDKKSCKLLYLFKSNKQIQQIQLSSQGILAQTGQDKILLWNLKVVKQEKVQMDGHSKQITILLISPDGLQLIARSDDLLSRWDLLEMKRLNFEINESKIPYKFCFSQDSQYLAAVDWYAFYLWKFNSKHMIGRYCKLYFDCLFNFEFNRLNNSLIFTKNELIIKWDVQKIENLNIQPFIQDQSQCFCEFIFSSCAESYVSTNPLQIVYIDDKGQQQFQKLKLNQDIKVGVIALSQDCKRLALVNQINNSIILLEVENNQQKLLIDEECSNTKILSMTFSENDKLLFSCHEDDKLRLWDVQDKFILIQKINAPYQCVFTEPFGVAYCQTIRTFPEKNDEFLIFWAATVNCYSDWAYEMNVYYYLKGEKKVLKDAGHQDAESLSAAYSSQKQLLAIQRIRNLQIYNLGSNELILNIKCDEAYKNNISTLLSFSPDGNILLGLSENNRINYWDLTDNQIIKLKWNLNQIVKANAIVYVPTKNVIRILGQDNMIYDLHKTEFVEMCQISKIKTEIKVNNEKKQYQSQNYTISFNEKQLEIFERKTQQLKYTLDSFFSGIRCLSESPCGFQFFLGMQDGSILCYKIEEELLNKYTKPVCYKVISNIPFFYAELCNINNSKFYSKDNENLNRLFIQKGAIEQKEAI